MQRQRRASLTLLEILVALGLAALLLSALFSSLTQMVKAGQRATLAEERSFDIERVRLRLTHLFHELSPRDVKAPIFFQTEVKPSDQKTLLAFATRGMISQEIEFTDLLEHQLLVKDGELCLMSGKSKKKKRSEVLLKGVESIRFAFFDPQTKQWLERWQSQLTPPPFFKLSLRIKGWKEDVDILFFLNTNREIFY